jgi:wobble nucleotide-excising tRNase
MIEKFISIKNVGKFVNYSAPKHVELERFNIIYGENATGKTTLSAILRSLKTNNIDYIKGRKTIDSDEEPEITIRLEGHNAEFSNNSWNTLFKNIEIFDAIFIAENVCAGYYVDHQHKKNLPLFALGEEGIQLVNRIVSLDQQIRQIGTRIRGKEEEIKRLMTVDIPIDKYLELPRNDDIDGKIAGQTTRIATLELSEVIIKKELLKGVKMPDWSWDQTKSLVAQSLETISEEAERNVKEHIKNYLDGKGEEWIDYGLNHIKDDKCPFCEQTLENVDLIQDYQRYFDTSYKDFKKEVKEYLEYIQETFCTDNLIVIEGTIHGNYILKDFWSNYVTFDFDLISLDFEEIKRRWDLLSHKIFEHLERKLLNPLETIVPNEDLLSEIEEFRNLQSNIVEYNRKVTELNGLIQETKKSIGTGNLNEAKNQLKRLQNQKIRHSPEGVRLCDEYKNLKDEKGDFEVEKVTARERLDQITQDLISEDGYQCSINRYLSNFGADFCIANQRTSYAGGRPSINYEIELCSKCIPLGDSETPESEPSFKNTLSEGDKSTLAFAFFLARLDHDEDIAEKILVFDDLINSLDIHRRNSTIQNILRLIPRARQVIVQTHDPIFARYLWNEADKSLTKCLCLKREGMGSVIREWDIEAETAGEYFENYFILEGFLTEGRGKKITVARCIRPLLECNLRLRFPGLFPESEWLGDYIGRIRTAEESSPLNVIKPLLEELAEINSYSKRFHHSSNPDADKTPINEPELKNYVKRTLKIIWSGFNVEDL